VYQAVVHFGVGNPCMQWGWVRYREVVSGQLALRRVSCHICFLPVLYLPFSDYWIRRFKDYLATEGIWELLYTNVKVRWNSTQNHVVRIFILRALNKKLSTIKGFEVTTAMLMRLLCFDMLHRLVWYRFIGISGEVLPAKHQCTSFEPEITVISRIRLNSYFNVCADYL
jgi:hypothetical protein